MTAIQIQDQVEQVFIDHELPHDMDAIRACSAVGIDRIAELEAQLKEARELAHIGGWTK